MSSLYSISIPVILNVLTVTSDILKKANEHASEKGEQISEYLQMRIYEDMLPLQVQVYIICSTSRKAVERLTGTAPAGSLGDVKQERTLEELLAMVADTAKVVEGVTPESIDGREKTRVPCALGKYSYEADLVDYIQGYPIPTVYFHLNMIYALLRGKGVPLGKMDYITPFMKKTFELKSTS
ncbi:hypothetical protein UCREL1_10084 [Eutypa lata UCREL1]|uniref:Helix-turn-helix-domain containing protein type protein n=1 Tax=Eutypa lata (strain UCR-EL1) TaxID=1287681 RepID=M7SZG1_EUTLA|nr:hypothetical protein UCREL1_10084 [Eutypa lata UCREL1]